MTKRQTPPCRKSNARVVSEKPVGPHQCARCSALVKHSNTSARGACSTLANTIERASSGSAIAADSARVIGSVLLLKLLQVVFQAVEAALPEGAEALEIVGGFLQPRRLEPAGPALGVAATADQARALKHVQVL